MLYPALKKETAILSIIQYTKCFVPQFTYVVYTWFALLK